MYKCKICSKEFNNKAGLIAHIKIHNVKTLDYFIKYEKFNIPKCECGKDCKYIKGLTFLKTCGDNKCSRSREINDNIKEKISISMKVAHKEGRANNWQDSKKEHNSSYPEIFFEKIILNEFDDKNYIKEYRQGPYSIDFAWLNKKIAVEIDGKQHNYPENKKRDIEKDKFLKNNNWIIIRIPWKELFNNTQYYIQYINDCINNVEINCDMIYESYNSYINYNELKKELNKINKNKKEKNKNIIIDNIINSNIDFSKQGWVKETAKIIGISEQKVTSWMRKNMYVFWKDVCFKRKGTKVI